MHRYPQWVSRPSRWTGLSRDDRQAERKRLLVRAAFELFAEGGESAVTVRSVCRHSALNSRYFYENFTDTDELLGAVYDDVVADLVEALTSAMADQGDDRARLRAGIKTVLGFSSADPGRGRILFTEARTNAVLSARRAAVQEQLQKSVIQDRRESRTAQVQELVGAAMYAGAMAELAQQWLSGTLGTDLDTVVETAVKVLMPQGIDA